VNVNNGYGQQAAENHSQNSSHNDRPPSSTTRSSRLGSMQRHQDFPGISGV
jgi:hypothetical protein